MFSIIIFTGIMDGTKVNPRYIPARIKNKLKSKFHYYDEPEWNLNSWSYKAFLKGYNSYKVISFNFWGNLSKVIVEIDFTKIPINVNENIKNEYAGYLIKKVYEVDSGGNISYQIELRKGIKIKHVKFKPDGTLIRVKDFSLVE